MRLANALRPARAPRKKATPSPRADQGRVRLINDPMAVARAIRAAEVSVRSGRRRLVDPMTCERDYSAAEWEFMQAMQEGKRKSGRMFPNWSEVLEVLHGLGYEKFAGPTAAPYIQPTLTGGSS